MNWLRGLKVDWTLIAFGYIAIKSFLVPTIQWSEMFGIVLVLVVHYAKRLLPDRKTFVQYEEDFFGMLRDLEANQKSLTQDVSNMKMAMGLKKERTL